LNWPTIYIQNREYIVFFREDEEIELWRCEESSNERLFLLWWNYIFKRMWPLLVRELDDLNLD